MKIVTCPGCGADLELPPGPGGGRVVCPYCEREFAPGGAHGPTRGASSRRSAGRSAGRRRGREYDDEDEDEYERPGRRRKMDATPIIVAIVAVVVLGGGLLFFMTKGKERGARIERERVAAMGTKTTAYFRPPNPLQVQGNAYEFYCDYQLNEKITFRKLDYNAHVSYSDSTGVKDQPLYSETYSIKGEITAEQIVAKEGDVATHEGRYEIRSFRLGSRDFVPDPVWVDARFRTDEFGKAVPGSFERIGGAQLPEWPALLPERGYDIMDGRAHRQGDRWGKEKLSEKVYSQLRIDGVNLKSIPLIEGGRQGGWFISGGSPIKTSRGNWEKRQAFLKLSLHAVENRRLENGRYKGVPADISVAVRWRGGGMYELGKRMISHVKGMSVTLEVVIKTRDTWHHWLSSEYVDAQILKDS